MDKRFYKTIFSLREFIKSNNTELLGAYGNLVNSTLVFIQKKFNSIVPKAMPDAAIKEALTLLYRDTGNKIENGEFKAALDNMFEFIRSMNKYYDEKKPWITLTQDPCSCGDTIYNCTNTIANLSVLLFPFLPFSSQKIFNWLKIDATWDYKEIDEGIVLDDITILFKRMDQDTKF